MPPWFFLSYARADVQGDTYLYDFFDDLCKVVRLGIDASFDAGFCDKRDIKTGSPWETDLREALANARVMLCMCSPAYVNSDYCGKELHVFSARVRDHAKARKLPNEPALVVPILWGFPNEAYPDALKRLQYKGPPSYETYGLRHLLKLKAYRPEYDLFVAELAQHVIAEAKLHALARRASLPVLDHTPNAFGSGAAPPDASGAGAAPGSVHFVYVAARPAELAGVRADVGAYQPHGGKYWRPYGPNADPAVLLAQAAATRSKAICLELPLDADLMTRIAQAAEGGEPVVLLVDAWTTRVATYRALLEDYDGRNFANCAVIVLWNEQDGETARAQDDLARSVREVFHFKSMLKSPYFSRPIRSAKQLQSKLLITLTELRAGRASGRAARTALSPELVDTALARGSAIATAPVVSGPGGGS